MELSNTNSKLLRDMASKTPGTFQHSMQVANLVEEVIFEIGGNALLARAGALYHDIGKMEMPMYFIENQNTAIPFAVSVISVTFSKFIKKYTSFFDFTLMNFIIISIN